MNRRLRYSLQRSPAGWACVLAVLLTAFGAAGALPGAAPAAVRAEVEALLATLEAPGCRFQRNGSWHTGMQAREHLTAKWHEMDRRRLVASTEAFIDEGASGSMVTGQPYRVQCGSAPAQTSRAWLIEQLRLLRARVK